MGDIAKKPLGVSARRWISGVLLLTLAMRVLIPAGYMPDFAALARGTLKVVVCSANGPRELAIDLTGQPAHDKSAPAKHSGEPCAFAGLAAATPPPDVILAPIAFLAAPTAHAAAPASILPPARAGPALGSRAPPALS